MTLLERFEIKMIPEPNSGCWIWIGSISKARRRITHAFDVRPNIRVGKTLRQAHRLSYQIYKGQITKGMWVLHACGNSLCVNPDHLYLGTAIQNTADRMKHGRDVYKDRTHCKNGHPFEGENLYQYKNYRQCRICKNLAVQRYYARKRLENA